VSPGLPVILPGAIPINQINKLIAIYTGVEKAPAIIGCNSEDSIKVGMTTGL
jgi:hypothetical protein